MGYLIQHCSEWSRQSLDLQETPHNSPSRASYGVFIVRIWEKIPRYNSSALHMIDEM